MAKVIRCLLLLIVALTINNAYSQSCYWNGSGYNSSCWACNDPSFPQWWKQQYCGASQSCVPRVESRVESCQNGYTGAITYNRNIVCANPYQEVVNDWYITSNTCTPICQTETQTQTLNCPNGYQGSILQTNTKTCPNNTWSGWQTTANSCQPIVTVEMQTLSCPVHQSGQITQQRTITANVAGAWQTITNTCTQDAPTCMPSTDQKTESCGLHYTGQKLYTKQNTCSNPYGSQIQGSWLLVSNTCTQDPPSCKTTTQTQTLSCQTGYVGAITQTQTSSCPDPYGQPVWGSWVTSSDTCVKSVTNVTNVMSPISPISPTNPTSVVNQSISTHALTTPSAPVTVQTPQNVQTTTTTETPSQTDTGGSVAPQTASPATSTPAPTVAPKSDTKQTANTPNSPKVNTVVGALIKFETITQSNIKQPDLFPIISINQAIPESIRRNQDLYFQFIQGETVDFGGEQDMRMNAIKQFTLDYENGFE